ncbi:MAG: hypothetical protein CVU73_15685 [Deltaproteobacteria bacterium HGW-Deltaproteobacteria-8]|jgi:hypothetical protein|nr:MAG: hypothetical protein CVU73_15685 [Deltaproteobacteria bacterium HGW-Deltaproteobacteria-8]
MHPFRIILTLTAVLFGALLLGACSGQPKIERVDVTWVSMEPSPRWGLYPGYRQEIPFKKGSAYQVDLYVKGKVITGGMVGDTGSSLAFRATAGARDIEAQSAGQGKLDISVTLKDEKGNSYRQLCLKVEHKDDKIWFEFPK